MRGNHLFGIFSPEKLKKVIPPHRAQAVQRKAQMRGNHLFGIFSRKAQKGDSPALGSRGPGRSPDAGESPFRQFSALKSSKR